MAKTSKKLTTSEIQSLAKLVKINLSDGEVATLLPQLNEILSYVTKLNEIPTENIQGTTHMVDFNTVTTPDKTNDVDCLKNLDGLKTVQHNNKSFFSVDKIM